MKPSDVAVLELDLGTDLERLGAILEENPAGAAGLWYGDKPVGYIPSLPVSESLRAEHILDAIVQDHDTEFLAAHLDRKQRDPKVGFSREHTGTVERGRSMGIPTGLPWEPEEAP
jgi:hypothetical protein